MNAPAPRWSALTLATADAEEALAFWMLVGYRLTGRFEGDRFLTLQGADGSKLNLQLVPGYEGRPFGRPVIHVHDVDALHAALARSGHATDGPPVDAIWGERVFHVIDPDGHEIAIATSLR